MLGLGLPLLKLGLDPNATVYGYIPGTRDDVTQNLGIEVKEVGHGVDREAVLDPRRVEPIAHGPIRVKVGRILFL